MKEFLNGIMGGFIVVALFLLFIFNTNVFNYKVNILVGKDVDTLEHFSEKSEILKELTNEGIIVTPQVYTNNIVNYYNTALTIVIATLIIFSIMSYIQLRFISRRQIGEVFKESLKDSKEFEQFVSDAIFGKAEERFASTEDMDKVLKKLEQIDVNNEIQNNEEQSLKRTKQ